MYPPYIMVKPMRSEEVLNIIKEEYGRIEDQPVFSFKLVNDNGVELSCINYGCIITKIVVPDREGNLENVVLGYETLEEYLSDSYFLGAVIGRVAGRIKEGTFELDGKVYHLAQNENTNHLHGGLKGFNQIIWESELIETQHEVGVRFSYMSPDGEEGYPGNLKVQVTYTLNNDNELSIHYSGISDEKTLLNMTNHSYFNLSGDLKRNIVNHTLMIKSDHYLELNDKLLPTGEMTDVKGTPFDFTEERMIHTGIYSIHPQNKLAGEGYDHPFVLNTQHDSEIVLKDKESGRMLTIETDEVGVVVYSGNQIKPEGTLLGVPSRKYLGICLETQGLPDAVHHPDFPSWVLEQNKEYNTTTKYKFGIVK
jgi:aldose 1-epimerase